MAAFSSELGAGTSQQPNGAKRKPSNSAGCAEDTKRSSSPRSNRSAGAEQGEKGGESLNAHKESMSWSAMLDNKANAEKVGEGCSKGKAQESWRRDLLKGKAVKFSSYEDAKCDADLERNNESAKDEEDLIGSVSELKQSEIDKIFDKSAKVNNAQQPNCS